MSLILHDNIGGTLFATGTLNRKIPAICANAYDLEKVPHGRIVHFVRDTDFGCEMRSRFWLFHATEIEAMRLMRHCVEEMGHLADFLPGLYMQKNVEIN